MLRGTYPPPQHLNTPPLESPYPQPQHLNTLPSGSLLILFNYCVLSNLHPSLGRKKLSWDLIDRVSVKQALTLLCELDHLQVTYRSRSGRENSLEEGGSGFGLEESRKMKAECS